MIPYLANKLAAADLLEAAGTVIQLPGWWTQYAFARAHDQNQTHPHNPEAICFCALGAIKAVGSISEVQGIAMRALRNTICMPISEFNDRSDMTGERIAEQMFIAADWLRAEVKETAS